MENRLIELLNKWYELEIKLPTEEWIKLHKETHLLLSHPEVKGTVSDEKFLQGLFEVLDGNYYNATEENEAIMKYIRSELLSLTSSKKEEMVDWNKIQDKIEEIVFECSDGYSPTGSIIEYLKTAFVSPPSIDEAEAVRFGEFLKKYHSIKWVNDLTTSELHSLYLKTKGQI